MVPAGGYGGGMFVITLTYKAPLEQVDEHLGGHVAWLDRNYAAGLFLASGRQVPRTGGVILSGGSRATVEAAVAQDPFAVAGVADYQIVEFTATKTAAGLEKLAEV